MDLLDIILISIVAVSLFGQLLLWSGLRKAKRREQELDARVQRLVGDLSALTRASTGAGEHLLEVEQHMRRLNDRQEQLELHTSGERPYDQAIQMVQKGASVEDLITSCGLTRGEADLIMMLHGMAKAS